MWEVWHLFRETSFFSSPNSNRLSRLSPFAIQNKQHLFVSFTPSLIFLYPRVLVTLEKFNFIHKLKEMNTILTDFITLEQIVMV